MTSPSANHDETVSILEPWLCRACEHVNRSDAQFCGRCGRPVDTTCAQCGTHNPGGHQYCDACGAPLYDTPSPHRSTPGLTRRLGQRLPDPRKMAPRQGLVWLTPHPNWQWSRQFLKAWTLRNRWELLALFLLTAVAAFLRIYRLEQIPAGFHGDEAWSGIEGLRILQEGWIGPYSTSAMGQATGPFYLTALLLWLFDVSRFSVRLSMGLFGIATIPAAHLLLRLGFGRWVALFGATALTFSYWHLHFSRLGFGLISLAFVATIAAITLLWAMRSKSRWPWLLAGACLGLVPYTYFAYPFFMAAVAAMLAYYMLLHQEALRGKLTSLAFFAAGSLIVAWPVISLILDSPDKYFVRMLGGSVGNYREFSEAGGTWESVEFLAQRAWYALKFLFANTRLDFVDGLGGKGALDLGTAVLAYVGLIVAIKRWRSPPHLFAVLALFFSLLALVVTEPSSGAMRRTIIAIPWVFGLAGIGAVSVSDTLRRRFGKWGRALATAAVAAVLLVGGIWNLNYYFVELPRGPAFKRTFPQYYFEALDTVNAFPDPGTIYYYSGQRSFTYETIRFLYAHNRGINRSREFGAFDLQKLDPGPVTYLLEGPYMQEIDTIMAMYPGGHLIVHDSTHPLYIIYHLPG
ncbi:MAG: zinc ribbon domain-containing protein [Caldilineaceae bacterium]|nr:zinc ribbon domain-containing protein [Caldilineaceae bacterium]